MKILVVADWHGAEIYAEVFKDGFKELGHSVESFSWKEYFHHYQYANRYETDGNKLKSFYYRFQNKFITGPAIAKINRDLLARISEFQPEMIFIYRGTHILPATLKKVKHISKCQIYGYNNDDPFSLKYPKYLWRHFLAGAKEYDHLFCYRQHNIEDYSGIDCQSASLLRSYYTDERNYLVNTDNSPYLCEVIFIGHFEDDGRDQCLLMLLKSSHNVKVYGTGWDKSSLYNQLVTLNGPIEPLYEDYNLALNSAKIAVVFLSKLNRDTYTRRCFEIPAAGALMISEYTDDLNSMFEQGVDADYFYNADELQEKVDFYLNNPETLNKMRKSGYERLHRDGHSAIHRVQEILAIQKLQKLKQNETI